MKPNFLVICGSIFTDTTLGNRTIKLVGACETMVEAEDLLGNLVKDTSMPITYYIIQFKQMVEVFMKPAVRIERDPQDIVMAEEG